MRTAYFDCTAGASGDMLLGAVLDVLGRVLGAWEDGIDELDLRPLAPWVSQIAGLLDCEPGGQFSLKRVIRAEVEALKIDFFVDEVHADAHHGHPRSHADIARLLDLQREQGNLKEPAFRLSSKIFSVLAEAEAKVHQMSPDDVHFHEVGAFDSLMDIAGFAAALSLIGVERIYASPVTLGSGTVESAHGVLPVPPPAVAEIVETFAVPTTDIVLAGECLTPTGAAVLAAVVDSWGEMPHFSKILAQGIGAGGRDTSGQPNVVCVTYGDVT